MKLKNQEFSEEVFSLTRALINDFNLLNLTSKIYPKYLILRFYAFERNEEFYGEGDRL